MPDLEIKSAVFWKEVKELAKEQEGDEILAYMCLMLKKSKENNVSISLDSFKNLGNEVPLFPGVEDWFKRINKYGEAKGLEVEHFIVSSGLREIIEGTKIAKNFKKIYASGFMYNKDKVAYWPALAINYTTKTQFLFRINKGTLNEYDNNVINKFVPDDERPVPFKNMVFIGDGATDIPAMKLVKSLGGHSIAVYKKDTRGAKKKVHELTKSGRVNVIAKADYSEDSAIEIAVKAMIDKVRADRDIAKTSSK